MTDTNAMRERAQAAMVDAARARGGAGAKFIADGHTNLWLDIAYDAILALLATDRAAGEGRSMTQEPGMMGEREAIADIIAAHVSSPRLDADMAAAHRQDQLAAADKIIARLAHSDETAGLVEQLARTQGMLEAIDRTGSTNMAEVRQHIVAIRTALASGASSNG